MSEDQYEEFYKKCTKMFMKSINRIISDKNIKFKKKLECMDQIDKYIDLASEKVFEG